MVVNGKMTGVVREAGINAHTGRWELLVEAPDGGLKAIVINDGSDIKLQGTAKSGYGCP